MHDVSYLYSYSNPFSHYGQYTLYEPSLGSSTEYSSLIRHIHNKVEYIYPSNGSRAQIEPWPRPLRFLKHTELDTR
jgi:hypothetical protein